MSDTLTTVRAKFTCSYVQESNNGNRIAHLYAVYSNDGENASFAKATPGGSLTLSVDEGTPAAGFFQQGADYYLDFTAVSSPKPDSL